MPHKKMIWKAFERAGVLESEDEKIKEFLAFLKNTPASCWIEVIPEFREHHEACFDTIVPILAEMDDPLIQSVLVKHADMAHPRERALVRKMADTVDPDRHPALIKQMSRLNDTSVTRRLQQRRLPKKFAPLITKSQT
ncbi:hypothetical protein [Desulfoluna spongiiphila]|uniref:HEAT repeat-containing protein n=1 Tax=Desulfoluna spongiiphila TaxID=419481 RepID=A0A1G5J248_9BACT|nr:hypothetical protein [Desulfoluna spongiiphila]SCY82433.1 hypothetical protein SAMN05216233_12430 [Desulfoluna spongiiphila]VVS94482.1 hypothetical protein DBB_40540 [Desulfoluna spongiiphila]